MAFKHEFGSSYFGQTQDMLKEQETYGAMEAIGTRMALADTHQVLSIYGHSLTMYIYID